MNLLPFEILALDLHNTLYDEVMEYGLALEAGVKIWQKALLEKHIICDAETLYEELAVAHAFLKNDWDDRVWQHLPSLQQAEFSPDEFAIIEQESIAARSHASYRLTTDTVYDEVVETLQHFHTKGVRIYIVTEAVANIAVQAVKWLGLTGIITGIYTYPSHIKPEISAAMYQKNFPLDAEGNHLKKPNAKLLAQIVLDDAIKQHLIPEKVAFDEVFEVAKDDSMSLDEFPASHPIQQDVTQQIMLKDSPYQQVLNHAISTMLYVGDSKFKDGVMARNIGVKFAHAEYGKTVKAGEEALFAKSRAILYQATGWDKSTLQLTQEAGKAAKIQALQPNMLLKNSLGVLKYC